MKRTISLILAALMLASSMASCGKNEPAETSAFETNAPETKLTETKAPETDAPETTAPAPSYDTSLITENGIAKSHIVLFDGADLSEKYASEELVTHIRLVSGADVTVTNAVQSDSLPIIIATPASYPELEELFPEDLAWLRDLGNSEERVAWGDDGFAIRQKDGKLYIFGATSRGALNGVYDFIEDNMGVLWIRATDMNEYPTVYDEMPTIEVTKADYREKSPFEIRSWTLSGDGLETQRLFSRNKLNTHVGYPFDEIAMQGFLSGHTIKSWITSSPIFDPDCNEYWGTDNDGNHYTREDAMSDYEGIQVNIWSDLTVNCIAQSIIAHLDANYSNGIRYIGVSLQDSSNIKVVPECTMPYEYAPGQFVDPSAGNYNSTVFFSFLNKIARIVAEKYPDINIHGYAYWGTIVPAECDLDYNVYATVCPIDEDLISLPGKSETPSGNKTYEQLVKWMEKTDRIHVYNYYTCYRAAPIYERPIWDRIQSDLLLYQSYGINGLTPEGHGDVHNPAWSVYTGGAQANKGPREPYYYFDKSFAMNALTFWIYSKLAWNPNENVDELIKYYCDKVYGDGSEYMQEYYRLLTLGLDYVRAAMEEEFISTFTYFTDPVYYWDYMIDIEVDGVHVYSEIVDNLHKAYEAANDKQKNHIRPIMDVYDHAEELFVLED